MNEVEIEFDNYYLVGGYRFPETLLKEAKKQPFKFLGKIKNNETVLNYNLEGKPLLDLPKDNPTYKSVRNIAKKAGYL
jgi:CO dehydrogenase maturation factor